MPLKFLTCLSCSLRRAAIAVVALMALSGCGASLPGVTLVEKPLQDGRTVTCILYTGGGIDCDWDNAK